jgi:hypothetical protein
LPECQNTLDAKHLPKLLESLQIEQSLWDLLLADAHLLPINLARGRKRAAETAALTDQK